MGFYNYNCVLVDDEEQYLNNLEELIDQFNKTNKRNIVLNVISKYNKISSFLDDLHALIKLDLVFFDLRFYENFNTGENFLRIVKPEKDTKFIVVSNYIREGLKETLRKPEIIDFIEKNKIEELLPDAIENFWIKKENLKAVFSEKSVRLFYNNEWVNIFYAEILYITSEKQQIQIFLVNNAPMIFMSANFVSLNDFQGKENLIRISKSKIINKTQILSVSQAKDSIYNTYYLQVKISNTLSFFKVGDQHEKEVALIAKEMDVFIE